MAKVYGQLDTLKRIKKALQDKGINRFSSIADINAFKNSFHQEKEKARQGVSMQIDKDLEQFLVKEKALELEIQHLKKLILTDWADKSSELELKIKSVKSDIAYNFVFEFIHWIHLRFLMWRKGKLETKIDESINTATKPIQEQLIMVRANILNIRENRDFVIDRRVSVELNEMNRVMDVIDEINSLIAGAIGESKVQKELEKLSDDVYLINDFSLKLDPPIYLKKEKDRVLSIQIDHLLVTSSGVFVLETKNWSQASVASLDFRSPVKQIRRTSKALFIIMNGTKGNEIGLKNHHWGNREIPIRSVVVMINEKPKEKFKYVQVKTLHELNDYVTYFEPIFNSNEVYGISNYLRSMINNQ